MGGLLSTESVVINEERKGTSEVIEISNRDWVETNEEFPMNYYVMESVGLEELDNFFKGLVPMLRNLKKAHYEIKAKRNHFIMITEADLLANYTLNDAIMSMIYCLTASNILFHIDISFHPYGGIDTSSSSPYISFNGKLSHQNTLIYKSWLELAKILTWASQQLKHEREFTGALEIRQKVPIVSVHLNMENFNRNLRKLEKASQIARETHYQVKSNLDIIKEIVSNKVYKFQTARVIANQAYQDNQFSPSEIILRYWPEQYRVIGKVSQSILRMNLAPPPVDEIPKPKARVDEESKQVAPAEDNFTCLFCLSLAEDAVELSCCSTIMCEKCSTQLNSTCPNCRRKFAAKPSIPIRRLIGNIAWRCTCGHSTTRSEMKSHLQRCPKQIPRSGHSAASNEPHVEPSQKRCRFKGCSFSGGRAALKAHIAAVHALQS
jgi:hypothetical protein